MYKKFLYVHFALAAAALLALWAELVHFLIIYKDLPETIGMHFGSNGDFDGALGKGCGGQNQAQRHQDCKQFLHSGLLPFWIGYGRSAPTARSGNSAPPLGFIISRFRKSCQCGDGQLPAYSFLIPANSRGLLPSWREFGD